VRSLQDSGYASGAIIISTSPLTSLPDESRGVSFHIWITRHLLLWLDPYIMRLNQYEKKSDGQAHLIVGEYWANNTDMTIFPEWMKDPIPNRLCTPRWGNECCISPRKREINANEWETKHTR